MPEVLYTSYSGRTIHTRHHKRVLMARVKRYDDDTNDIENYKHLGKMTWKEALNKAYSPGVDTVSFSPDMFSELGMERLLPRHKTRDKVMVNYDREYVFYRLFNLFIKKLGIMQNGVFNDQLYALLMNGLKDYSLRQSEREHEALLLRAAKGLDDKLPGMGVQHWYQVLKTQQEHRKGE